MKVSEFIEKRGYISSVVDNRSNFSDGAAGLITITLMKGYFFKDQPDVNRQSFCNMRLACAACSKNNVFNHEEDMKKTELKGAKVKVQKVQKVAKAAKAAKVLEVTVSGKVLSTTPDAIRKREKRAQQKVAAAMVL